MELSSFEQELGCVPASAARFAHFAHFAQGALCCLRKSGINHHQAWIMHRKHFHGRSPRVKENIVPFKKMRSLCDLISEAPLLLADDFEIRNISSTCMIQMLCAHQIFWWNKGIKDPTQHLAIAKESLVWQLTAPSLHSLPKRSTTRGGFIKPGMSESWEENQQKMLPKSKRKTPKMSVALWMEPYSF